MRKPTLLAALVALAVGGTALTAEARVHVVYSPKAKSGQRAKIVKAPAKSLVGVKTSRLAKASKLVKAPNARITKVSLSTRLAREEREAKLARIMKPRPAVASSDDGNLDLKSSSALVLDQRSGDVLYAKNANSAVPIASITKLMTAMVVLDAGLSLDEPITIAPSDVDTLRGSGSRLAVGTTLSRRETLLLALMSSENRAAAALARTYPGGTQAFVTAMNRKARSLGMRDTFFVDSTGLHSQNVSTASDLSKMVRASYRYDLIRHVTTTTNYEVETPRGRVAYRNTNALVKDDDWHIGLSKTGYINEAGHCLVMQARIAERPTIIVLLDSWGKLSRLGDANRVKRWIESGGRSTHAARNGGTAS